MRLARILRVGKQRIHINRMDSVFFAKIQNMLSRERRIRRSRLKMFQVILVYAGTAF